MESCSDSIDIEPSKIKLILNVSKSIFKNFEKTMRIIAETNDLEPPYPSKNATFRLQLNEDQVLPLGAAELEYFDDFSGPEDVTFEIIKSCHCVKCNRHLKDPNDLGRIVDLSNSLDWEKNENYQPVTSFTQRQLNHLRLGYQPPRRVSNLNLIG